MSTTTAHSSTSNVAAAAVSTDSLEGTLRSRRNVTFNVATSACKEADDVCGDQLSLTQNTSFVAGGEGSAAAAEHSAPPSTRRLSVSAVSAANSRKTSVASLPSHANDAAHGANAAPLFTLAREDVQAAFDFFDVQRTGVLTMASLKPRLSAFYPNLTSKEYRFLLEDPVSVTGASGVGGAELRTTSGGGGGGSSSNATCGFTADHLWELIDIYQRLYVGSAGAAAGPAGSSANGGGGAPTERVASGGGGHHSRSSHTRRSSAVGGQSSENRSPPSPSVGPTSTSPSGAVGIPNALSAGGGGTTAVTQIFDPVFEAFRVYDPTGRKKCVDTEILGQIMARIGYGELSDEELSLLVRTADFDGDGKISLEDFRRLVSAKGRLGGNSNGGDGKNRK